MSDKPIYTGMIGAQIAAAREHQARLGTPKTLKEAIANGCHVAELAGVDAPTTTDLIAEHVRDYLAQKFNIAILAQPDNGRADELMDLFSMVVNKPRTNRLDSSFMPRVDSDRKKE